MPKMSEARDPAIKLFGKTIPLPEVPPSLSDSAAVGEKVAAPDLGDRVASSSNSSSPGGEEFNGGRDGGEEKEEVNNGGDDEVRVAGVFEMGVGIGF